jgi:hypothetical protein
MKYLITILLLVFGMAALSDAQQPAKEANKKDTPAQQSDAAKRMDEVLNEDQAKGGKESEIKEPGSKGLGNSVLPDASSLEGLDQPTKEQYYAAMREYYGYRILGYKHRMDIFNWQFFSSKIIFFVVIFLVLTGVYFSGVQFHSSMRQKHVIGPATKDGAAVMAAIEKSEITEVEASLKGIKVSSPILGVIILVISFMFFYLYLLFVYPIVDAF